MSPVVVPKISKRPLAQTLLRAPQQVIKTPQSLIRVHLRPLIQGKWPCSVPDSMRSAAKVGVEMSKV